MRRQFSTFLAGTLRVAGVISASVGAVLLFVLSLVAGVLLHLDVPVARRLATHALNGLLGTQFKGKITIDRLAHLSVLGVRGVDATITAEDGTRVIVVRGVSARISPLQIMKSALFGKGDIRLGIDAASIDAAEVDLDAQPDGSLKLVAAFDPATPSSPAPPPAPDARGIAIALDDVAVAHVWAHGTIPGAPPIDADVDALRGSFLSATAVTTLDVQRLHLLARGLPMQVRASADVEGHLAMPSPSGATMAVRGKLAGLVGQIPLTASVSMNGDALDGVLDVPQVTAEEVRASIEGAPVYDTVSAHGEAHGELSALRVALDAHAGRGKVALSGVVHATGALGGRVSLVASHLDARTFAAGAPATDVGAEVLATAETRPDGLVVASATVELPEGTAAGQVTPPASLRLSATEHPVKDASARSLGAHLEGVIREQGAPIALTADATSHEETMKVTFGVKAAAPRLADVKRLGNVGAGSAEIAVTGQAAIGKETSFTADVVLGARGFDRPGMAHVDTLHAGAKVQGTPANPQIQALVVATGVRASAYRFARAEVEVAGTPKAGRVALSAVGDGSPDVALRGDVALSPALTVRDLSVALDRHASSLRLDVDSVRVEGGTVDAQGVLLEGAGAPLRASLHASHGSLAVVASTKGLDLHKLAAMVGKAERASGTLALDVDVDARRDWAKGKVAVDLTKGAWSNVHDAEAHLGLALDGRRLTGQLRAALGAVGSVDVSDVDVHLGGQGALDANAWKNAWGKLSLSGAVDVARLAALAPAGSLHVSDVAGRVTLSGHLERDSIADTTPEIRLLLSTEGLAAKGQAVLPVREPGGPVMVGPPTWSLQGVDARVDLLVDGADSAGELAVRLMDEAAEKKTILYLDFKTAPLPFETLFTGEGDLVALLESLPVSLAVDLPKREISALPLMIRPDGVRGGLAANLSMKGTLLEPTLDVALTTGKLVVAAVPDTPMDCAVHVVYDGANALADVDVKTPTSALLTAKANLRASARDAILARGLPAQWGGDVTAKLARFPLGAIGMLSDNQVAGLVSGDVDVTGLHEDAKADVHLKLEQLAMGKARFTKGAVGATLGGQGLDAKLRLDASDGFLEAGAHMGMKWGAALAPTADGTGLQAKLTAKHFSAAAAAPFASSALSELSGWVDADATVVLVPHEKPKMAGVVSFSDGVVEVPSIGESFHAVKAKVTLDEGGLLKLEDAEARGLSGLLTVSGSAHLDGTTLTAADLALDIPKNSAIPLDIQGSNLGTVYGSVKVNATGTPDGKLLKVAVVVPHAHVDLPSGSLPRSPQALADAPSVHLGTYLGPDRFLVLPVDGAPVSLVAERNAASAPALPASGGAGAPVLVEPAPGKAQAAKEAPPSTEVDATIHVADVQIVRGQQVAVNLDGDLTAKVAAATTVRGEIHLKSGKLTLQSKQFEIEKGTISFVGDDPSNPEVTVTAAWTAPDGTKVLADYVGPAKTGKVNLRSEPPRPKNEIVQLILFGTADGSEATPYASKSPSTGMETGTAVGGLATEGLSKGLDQLTGLDVTTKVDTSDSASPRADVELQIAKDISLQLAYVLVQPPPGENPDLVYATVAWRFVRNWSLETTFGDAGSTFADMVWNYRY